MSASQKTPSLLTIIAMTGMAVVSLNMIVPAFSEMALEFDVNYGTVNLLFSGYLIITGFLTVLSGPLSDRFGRRPVALACMGTFAVASLGCAIAPTLELLFFFRFIQGVVVGTAVVSQAVIRDTSETTAQATRKLASVAMVMGIAPLIGPTIGGALADWFGWRAIFGLQSALGAVILGLVWFDLRETNPQKSVTMLAQVLDYPSLLASLRFWGYALTLSLGISVFFSFLSGMPLIGKAEFQLSQTQIGMYMGTLTVGYIIANGITRQIADHFRNSTIMVFGRLIGIAGVLASLALFYAGVSAPFVLLAPLMLLGAANGFSLQPANAGVVSVNPRLAGSAAGLSGGMVSWFGAAASAVISYLLAGNPTSEFFFMLLLGASLIALLPTVLIAFLDRQDAATPST